MMVGEDGMAEARDNIGCQNARDERGVRPLAENTGRECETCRRRISRENKEAFGRQEEI